MTRERNLAYQSGIGQKARDTLHILLCRTHYTQLSFGSALRTINDTPICTAFQAFEFFPLLPGHSHNSCLSRPSRRLRLRFEFWTSCEDDKQRWGFGVGPPRSGCHVYIRVDVEPLFHDIFRAL